MDLGSHVLGLGDDEVPLCTPGRNRAQLYIYGTTDLEAPRGVAQLRWGVGKDHGV
jgi:hypothetical protein